MNIKQWVKYYQDGKFENKMLAAGWFDWFCTRKELSKKTDELAKFLIKIKDCPNLKDANVQLQNSHECDRIHLTNGKCKIIIMRFNGPIIFRWGVYITINGELYKDKTWLTFNQAAKILMNN